MQFPIVVHKDPDSDYGVTVPDLPGCFTAGSTIDEALAMAKEAIEAYLEQIIEQGKLTPPTSPIEALHRKREYKGGTWALVTIDESTLRVKAKRINITIPERILDAIDRYAEKAGQTRSGLIVQAVMEYMGRGSDDTLPRAKVGRPKTRGKTTKKKGR